jgi:hypothetical protein
VGRNREVGSGRSLDERRRGKELAGHRTLLILDGLEPMQFGPGPQEGQLKDPALKSLLRSIAQRPFDGLCVLTTREPVKDLERFHGTTVIERKLENLSPLAGAKLLHHRGVDHAGAGKIKADDKELQDAVEEVAGHALTLQLMGNYLHRAHGGDIRRKDRFGFKPAMKYMKDQHAFRAIAVYERWLSGQLEEHDKVEQQYDREEGEPMLAVLRMLGLFDRPASADCLDALRRKPAIPGRNEPLVDLTDEEWNGVLFNLEKLDLVQLEILESLVPTVVDAHPLIREYFAQQLKQDPARSGSSPGMEGHRRLYQHLCETTEYRPETVKGLAPLYLAVTHGCLGDLHEEACVDVYRDRILRGTGNDGYFPSQKLGAIGADLGAVESFFERPWSDLSPNLSPDHKAWLLNEVAFGLRSLGRLTEAIEPMRASLDLDLEREDWMGAARSAGNLSELQLTLGLIGDSEELAREVVTLADRTHDAFLRLVMRTTLADVLRHGSSSADVSTAGQLFAEAEIIQTDRQPDYPQLYSLPGFRYCDLLLSAPERRAWIISLQGPNSRVANVDTTSDVTSGDVTSGDVTSGDVTSGDVTSGDVTSGDEVERRRGRAASSQDTDLGGLPALDPRRRS